MNIRHLEIYLQHFVESPITILSNHQVMFNDYTSVDQINAGVVNYFIQYGDNKNLLSKPTILSDIIVVPPASLVTDIQDFLDAYGWAMLYNQNKLRVQYMDDMPVVYNPDNYLLIDQSQNAIIRN